MELKQIPLARDLKLALFLSDPEDQTLLTPHELHTRIRFFVNGECFECNCDDTTNTFENCDIMPAMIDVVEEAPGKFRIPYQGESAIQKKMDAIICYIPSDSFSSEGILNVAFCNVLPDGKFPDKTADNWSVARPTVYQYLKF